MLDQKGAHNHGVKVKYGNSLWKNEDLKVKTKPEKLLILGITSNINVFMLKGCCSEK